MRCKNCNVDLPEFYTACPLCGEKTTPDEPVIKGILTAEYPKVKTEPNKKNPFLIFLIIWAAVGVISLLLNKFDIINDLSCGMVICAVPAIWTLFLRPVFVKQLFPGNYEIMNFYPFALASVVYSKISFGSTDMAITTYLPLCCLAVMIALAVIILLNRKESKRAASYPVLMLPVSVIGLIVSVTKNAGFPAYWVAAIIVCVLIFVAIYIANPKEVKEELEAKFSIQKSISTFQNK